MIVQLLHPFGMNLGHIVSLPWIFVKVVQFHTI